QLAMRYESVYGPYEVMRTLDVGSSEINGPHQGALIETQSGEWWFMHFQDMGVYGRIAHLQSVEWRDGWPVMGVKRKGYCGEPAMSYTKPNVGATYPIQTPATSDEFDQPKLSLQWQWHANPKSTWALPTAMGYCRLYGEFRPEEFVNLWSVPNLLLQKLAAPIITATMKSKVVLRNAGDMAAMLSMGGSYSYIAISRDDNNQYTIKQIACNDARGGSAERVVAEVSPKNLKITQVSNGTTRFQEVEIYFQLRMEQGGKTSLYYSCDGKKFLPLGEEFAATKGRWIGGKIGMFVLTTNPTGQRSWMDVDYFRVE
ncbi:MAG: glycoside hydrolase, partial [Rikenellaceae bacterium]